MELLVVMVVIAILAGLILPSLSRAKSAAYRIKCASSLRQFGIATQLYWDDNNGNCFRIGGTTATNNGYIYWFGWIENASAGEGNRAFDFSLSVLYPYFQGRGVEICPSLNYALAQFKLKATGPTTGFGYNSCLSASIGSPPLRISSGVRPAGFLLFADSAQVNTFEAPASIRNPMLEEFYYVSTNASEMTAHFRHTQRANVIYGDGHVDLERMLSGSLDTRLASQYVGRLRPEILRFQ